MTILMYLDDTYLSDSTATVVASGSDERGPFLVLDRSVFYPQGGGQPADQGVMLIDGVPITVTSVGFVDLNVRHYVRSSAPSECIGKLAELKVDGTIRMANARLHTAGHHVSHTIETICDRLSPIKGYHFPDGAYVEFASRGDVDLTALIREANEIIADDIRNAIPVTASYSDFAEISELRPQLSVFVPRDKPSRIVTIGRYKPLPCGGTHVGDLGQLGKLCVTKAKRNKGNVRVSYRLD